MRALRLVAASVATAAALLAPAAAHAALTWKPCTPAGFQCGSVAVPLDRSGATPGTVTLAATRVPAATNPARTAVVALAGGPGQAALPLAPDFAEVLGAGLATRDLLVFDQRGTGASGSLQCSALETGAGSLTSAVQRCADQLGPARAFFTTAQSVQDLESLRVEAGYDKLVLFGVSYGTKVAEDYAAAYPGNVAGLVLDSVVPPEGQDALRRSTFKAVPRVLGELCAGGACRGITPDATADLGKVVARLRRHSIRGPVYDGHGRRYTAHLTQSGLSSILLAGDLNPTLRAELPGSLRAALAGDVKPLLRLSARSAGLENRARLASENRARPASADRARVASADRAQLPSESADSDALFLATTCEDSATMPWTRGAPLRQRRREAVGAAKALPAADFAPFSPAVALDQYPDICLGYPVASPPPAPIGALPAVPTLILDGQADLRTPVENAQALQARIPGAQLVTVPYAGHSVTGADASGCAASAIAAFFAGRAAGPCPASPNPFAPTPRPPASLAKVAPYRPVAGTAGRTVEAVRDTINDGSRQVVGETLALGARPTAVGGLRGGSLRVSSAGTLRFARYEYVPGVTLTGSVPDHGTAVLHVGGAKAARGTLRISRSGAVSGTLHGHRVHARFRSASAAGAHRAVPYTQAEALRRGRLVRGLG
jgi:pimeloyl-ACP methyl ester carboxylesterase